MAIFRELTRYRFLAVALAHRELTVRYKRSVLGVLWSLAEPAVLVVVYSGVFGVLFGASRNVENYPLFTLFGLLPWLFFSSAIDAASPVLLENAGLIRKIYFPREFLVASVVFSRGTTFFVALLIATVVAGIGGATGSEIAFARIWWFLPGGALLTALTLGLAFALSTLNVLLRDVGFVTRFGLRLGFYAVPIVYSRELVPAAVRPIYNLNPLVTITHLFQGIASPTLQPPMAGEFITASICSFVAIAGGWWTFRRLGPTVVDAL
jgi:lipopolysaccharide transport system permease protein